ncbi:VanZ family protein [Clostridium bornimense]|nr:VanZ family protein [Clostridium bornimense]
MWTNLRNLKKIFLIGLITSLSIEILQLIENILYLGFRSVDIDDVIFNVIGIILGYSLFKVLSTSKNKFQFCK